MEASCDEMNQRRDANAAMYIEERLEQQSYFPEKGQNSNKNISVNEHNRMET